MTSASTARRSAKNTSRFDGVLPRARNRIERLRARFDRVLLRTQGRTDTPAFDLVAPWIWALLLGTVLLWLAMARSYSIDMGTALAESIQAVWLIEEGYKPIATLAGGNLLAEQAAFLLYPVALLTNFLPRVGTLLALQSFALASSVIPLWRIARGPGTLRVGATAAVIFAFSVYAAVHNVNVSGFHIESFALPALIAAVLFGFTDREIRMWIAIAVVLLARADLGLVIAGLGLLFAFEGRRRRGVLVAVVGFGWLLAAVFVIQPLLSDTGMWPHVEAFVGFGEAPLEILAGIVQHPIQFLRLVASQTNFIAIVTLLAPVLFLPVVAPRYLMPALPLYAIYLAADVPVGRLSESPQTIPMTAFVFVATVFAMQRSGRIMVQRVNVDRRVIVALLMTASVFFVRDASTSLYEQPWNWAERTDNDLALIEAADMVEPWRPVRASPRALPLLADRLGAYELVTLRAQADAAKQDAIVDVDYILYDGAASPGFDGTQFCNLLAIDGWRLEYEFAPVDDEGQPIRDQVVRLWRYVAEVSEGCS